MIDVDEIYPLLDNGELSDIILEASLSVLFIFLINLAIRKKIDTQMK